MLLCHRTQTSLYKIISSKIDRENIEYTKEGMNKKQSILLLPHYSLLAKISKATTYILSRWRDLKMVFS